MDAKENRPAMQGGFLEKSCAKLFLFLRRLLGLLHGLLSWFLRHLQITSFRAIKNIMPLLHKYRSADAETLGKVVRSCRNIYFVEMKSVRVVAVDGAESPCENSRV